ncbi:MAG: hypothetical protein JNK82_04820 [Myxococcaceae bacterium]|nr:hypothetical protein [Myxococcaceae bacterium]
MSAWLPDSMQGLPARVLLPEPYTQGRKYPLVVFLHGSAERGTDNGAQLKGVHVLEERRPPAIVVAPQCPSGDTFGGSWYGGGSATQDKVVALVRELRGRSSVDASRVALVGFSMGAIGLWAMLERHRSLFSRAMPIAGDLDPSSVAGLEGFPIWAFHGGRDDLVPNVNTRAAMARLEAAGRYTELPGAGHDIAASVLSRGDVQDWLLR